MPELPEVETTLTSIAPLIRGQLIGDVIIRNRRLRRPVPPTLRRTLCGETITALDRRGKYLLCQIGNGYLLIHFGMSGSLRVVHATSMPNKHDHVDIVLGSGRVLRFHDPRRFGMIIWTRGNPLQHELLKDLGPEPLTDQFDGEWLYRQSKRRTLAVKNFIMDGRTVAGVGNIYANESLFLAKIHPRRRANRISKHRYDCLATSIKTILTKAIQRGGSTLRDFVDGMGAPGYFQQQLAVYQRAGYACPHCQSKIVTCLIGQRSAFYCHVCQT